MLRPRRAGLTRRAWRPSGGCSGSGPAWRSWSPSTERSKAAHSKRNWVKRISPIMFQPILANARSGFPGVKTSLATGCVLHSAHRWCSRRCGAELPALVARPPPPRSSAPHRNAHYAPPPRSTATPTSWQRLAPCFARRPPRRRWRSIRPPPPPPATATIAPSRGPPSSPLPPPRSWAPPRSSWGARRWPALALGAAAAAALSPRRRCRARRGAPPTRRRRRPTPPAAGRRRRRGCGGCLWATQRRRWRSATSLRAWCTWSGGVGRASSRLQHPRRGRTRLNTTVRHLRAEGLLPRAPCASAAAELAGCSPFRASVRFSPRTCCSEPAAQVQSQVPWSNSSGWHCYDHFTGLPRSPYNDSGVLPVLLSRLRSGLVCKVVWSAHRRPSQPLPGHPLLYPDAVRAGGASSSPPPWCGGRRLPRRLWRVRPRGGGLPWNDRACWRPREGGDRSNGPPLPWTDVVGAVPRRGAGCVCPHLYLVRRGWLRRVTRRPPSGRPPPQSRLAGGPTCWPLDAARHPRGGDADRGRPRGGSAGGGRGGGSGSSSDVCTDRYANSNADGDTRCDGGWSGSVGVRRPLWSLGTGGRTARCVSVRALKVLAARLGMARHAKGTCAVGPVSVASARTQQRRCWWCGGWGGGVRRNRSQRPLRRQVRWQWGSL